jgi:V8-like Glu-specific endopeptidase
MATQYVGNISNTYPFSAVVFVLSKFPNGKVYTGSGAIVGDNDVLTASHVVYSAEDGGVATDVIVFPGLDETKKPFGSYSALRMDSNEIESVDRQPASNWDVDNDVAILGFNEDINDRTGSFGLDPFRSSDNYNITGYPTVYSTIDGPKMTNDYGRLFNFNQNWEYGTVEVNPGNSGGPVWYEAINGPYIVGVVSTSIYATDIFHQYNKILGWMSGNNYLMYPNNVAHLIIHSLMVFRLELLSNVVYGLLKRQPVFDRQFV